jgi:hypothetical protein
LRKHQAGAIITSTPASADLCSALVDPPGPVCTGFRVLGLSRRIGGRRHGERLWRRKKQAKSRQVMSQTGSFDLDGKFSRPEIQAPRSTKAKPTQERMACGDCHRLPSGS